jgi:hypothetical protein
MQIFNIQINGIDAEEFCKQSTTYKLKWIKANTNQQNDSIIMEFLQNPNKTDKCGCGCTEKKVVKKQTTKKKKD